MASIPEYEVLHLLSLGAFEKKDQKSLFFFILNETKQLISYRRAFLWKITRNKTQLLSVSGNLPFEPRSPFVQSWKKILAQIPISRTQEIDPTQWLDSNAYSQMESFAFFWQPFTINKTVTFGLCLERTKQSKGVNWAEEEKHLFSMLLDVYGVCLKKQCRPLVHWKKKSILVGILLFFIITSLIRIPLRVVASCEVVPQHPNVITAPLDGIISEVVVSPGQKVKKGDLLFFYDKEAALQGLKVSSKQVEIMESALNQSLVSAFEDKKMLSEIKKLYLSLEREKIQLAFAQYQADRLDVVAPIDGIVILQNAEMWKGNPVQIGERILMVADPNKTQVKIWLPESDHVVLEQETKGKVFLHPRPEKSYHINVQYISNYLTVNDKGMSAFVCEADWSTDPDDITIGLQGTSVLYGKNVSLLYWIIRRPWIFLRQMIGV